MGLSFLTPMLLAGAALVAVPVVLHLLMKRRPVKLDFPALRFLRQKAAANRRQLRLSHLLLLLLRMAALALLALALARPTLRGAGWLADGEGPVAAVLVVDTAPRMLLVEANETRLEKAAALAKMLLAKLPPTSQVAVVDTTGGIATFSPTVAAAATRIDRLAGATPSLTLSAAMAAGYKLLDTVPDRHREMYVFTDCSHGAWDGQAPQELSAAHPDISLVYVDVGARNPQNFAIDSVDVTGDLLAAGTPLALTAATSRAGPDANRDIAVEMLGDDGRYTRRAIKRCTWKSGAVGQVAFEISGLEPGVRQGRVILEGSDALDADNVRYFTVEVGSPARVLVAAPAPAQATGRCVMQAIAPASLRKAGKARFEATLQDVAQLEAVPWDGYEGMVLVDPPPLPVRTWDLLWQWVAGGKGLVVWLGPQAADAGRFDSDAAQKVLGGRIVRVWRSPDDANFLAPASLDHPVLAAFRRVGDAVPWQDFPVHRHWEFQPNEAATGAAGEAVAAIPVAAYRNGLPAILEHRVGQGTVITITTPVSQSAGDPAAWNTLATGFEPWPFVMLANETLLHSIDTADDRNVLAGTPAVMHLERRDIASAFVRTPAGDDFPVAVDQRRGTITVTATQMPGNYVLRSGGAVGGITKGFSANLVSAATDTLRLPEPALAATFGEGRKLAATEAELVRDVKLERVGTELSGWIILLAAAAMAGDWIVANRFYAPRDDAQPPTATTAGFSPAAAIPPSPRTPPPLPGAPPPLPTMEEVGA